ncbi:TetR/AcrR family transcriptional regulator [Pontibacter oryzae]|uniref:TetR/AcrR family transcriptional regulator n=1 Tax=Pontibacter oryzae TaxID=2304593 RepID=A0A399RT53_9BACT|nr:TetR/AcrR family transcriptional regulator [Pontibacter oryzae]RIJ34268.1 TetR/AcrR family transcriptional regulator [Pontibacter oryzae]
MSEKRDRIISAALQLFCENGFQHTSTAAISKKAGVATGTLFLYFKSKDELINALYLETKAALSKHMQEGLEQAATVHDKLFHIWLKSVGWSEANPYHFRFFNMFSNSAFISALTKDEAASLFQFTEELVKNAVAEGSIAPIETGLFVSLFGGQLNATINYLAQSPQPENRQQIVEKAFRLFWKSMKA